MGLLNEAVSVVVADLAAAGVTAITDIRNAQPPCVLIDPPTIRGISANLVTLDIPVSVIAPPPGNADAQTWLLDTADEIMAALPVITGTPGTVTNGQMEMPAYSLTVTMTFRRD